MAHALRLVGLLALWMLLGVPQVADAYPATAGSGWRHNAVGPACSPKAASGYTYGSGQAACDAIGTNQAFLANQGDCTPNTDWTVTAEPLAGSTCQWKRTLTVNPALFYFFGAGSVEEGTGYTCPGGGTLSGDQCTCTAPETDNGSACVSPSACPAGQYDPIGGPTECVPICGANEAVYDPAGQGFNYPSGAKTFCVETTVAGEGGNVTAHCLAEPTGSIIVCADYGDGSSVACYSEHARNTGGLCAAAVDTTLPPDETACSAGDVWCEATGPCPTGFVGGSFNGKEICVKKGEAVTAVPQPKSATAPPVPSSVTSPPTQTNPGTRDGETNDPNTRTVIGVGAGTLGGGGDGGGGGGEDIITCGLPNTPKCKIDETGTPTKGEWADATKSLDDAQKARTDGLATVTSSENKATSWSWNLALPTGCQPVTLNMVVRTITLDPCGYQGVMHDLMSMLWAASTLFAVFSMVGRTLRES